MLRARGLGTLRRVYTGIRVRYWGVENDKGCNFYGSSKGQKGLFGCFINYSNCKAIKKCLTCDVLHSYIKIVFVSGTLSRSSSF